MTFQYRDKRGLRASISRHQPVSATVYVEGSLCQRTGAAGWGSVVLQGDQVQERGGPLFGPFHGIVTIMELQAMERAVSALSEDVGEVTIASRSTAALAVLRWVFPDAEFIGEEVDQPKRLRKIVREAPTLYDLDDLLERRKTKVRLMRALPSSITTTAQTLARAEMVRARQADRSANA